jgi:hypothetical protein
MLEVSLPLADLRRQQQQLANEFRVAFQYMLSAVAFISRGSPRLPSRRSLGPSPKLGHNQRVDLLKEPRE